MEENNFIEFTISSNKFYYYGGKKRKFIPMFLYNVINLFKIKFSKKTIYERTNYKLIGVEDSYTSEAEILAKREEFRKKFEVE